MSTAPGSQPLTMGEGDGNRARLMQRRVRVWLGVGGVVVLALALLA